MKLEPFAVRHIGKGKIEEDLLASEWFLCERCREVLVPNLAEYVVKVGQSENELNDYVIMCGACQGPRITERYAIVPSAIVAKVEDDRDLDFEYVDANGNVVDATGAVFERRRRRFYCLFLG